MQAREAPLWRVSCTKSIEGLDNVADLIARMFVVAFALVYFVLMVAWLIWNFRNWLAGRFNKGVWAGLRTQFHRLDFSHHNRNTH